MEQRKCERVQFFQVLHEDQVIPVWVFRGEHPDSLLGLILDISDAGVQILMDNATLCPEGNYQLSVRTDDTSDSGCATVQVRRIWSHTDGALYTRNGFTYVETADHTPFCDAIMAAQKAGQLWLRCELIPC